ncbi:MAG: EFR1 family ferrodoxin [Methanobacterium paludis]|nr:EFR1 family ferrodoxin [Methanobacterium paludis]
MDNEIYYFSGTGNSLHVAKQLKKRIPETELIPIVSLLNREVVETSAETVGFVFPIHLMTVPRPLKSFLEKIDLKSAKYIFAVATRGGSKIRAFIDLEKILKEKGKCLDSYFVLNMASNDPKFEDWHQATEEEVAKLEYGVQDRLGLIERVIINKEKNREKDTHFTVPTPFLFLIFAPLLPTLNKFYNVAIPTTSPLIQIGTSSKEVVPVGLSET